MNWKVIGAIALLAMIAMTVLISLGSSSYFRVNTDFQTLIKNTYVEPLNDSVMEKMLFREIEKKDEFTQADVLLLWGRYRENKSMVCSSIGKYQEYAEKASGEEKALALESVYAVKKECGLQGSLKEAINAWEDAGIKWRAEQLSLKEESFVLKDDVGLECRLDVPAKPERIIIGRSHIMIEKNSVIGTQVERVFRDWLSGIMHSPFKMEYNVEWHEGARTKELIEKAEVDVKPLAGTILRKFGNKWYAPDEKGVYRFHVLDDKVLNYPTTRFLDEKTAVFVDTHGISALVEQAIRKNNSLVIGCGDWTGKMKAARYLNQKGIDVYVACDRFLPELIGCEEEGITIGSAPIREHEKGAIIGNQSIEIMVEEPIVVEYTDKVYPAQYYDTPWRYFTLLEERTELDLDLHVVDIDSGLKGVLEEAEEVDSSVVGVRIWTQEEHDLIAQWLSEDSNRRAVLFHSAAYKPGYSIFFEFPEQTSFDDPMPKII